MTIGIFQLDKKVQKNFAKQLNDFWWRIFTNGKFIHFNVMHSSKC